MKRVKKTKSDTSEGWVGEADVPQGELSSSNSILEISGPTIPSPGPSGAENEPLTYSYSQNSSFLSTLTNGLY